MLMQPVSGPPGVGAVCQSFLFWLLLYHRTSSVIRQHINGKSVKIERWMDFPEGSQFVETEANIKI